ncbi:hypothetical protein [Mesorhizobium sp. M5C.F.Ca.IN.020.29.1.1]|nr:hypothetical protein [Mesorhizobium sp. M5C.F.Ca.IN.020.29.1.1]
MDSIMERAIEITSADKLVYEVLANTEERVRRMCQIVELQSVNAE